MATTQAKTVPFTTRRGRDRWTQVAYISGKLAARSGSANTSNPHPAGSDSAKGWIDGWQAQTGACSTALSDSPTTDADRPLRLESELTMDVLKRLPDLPDADLGTLGVNAQRLALSGNPKQKLAAQAALPAIQEELAIRQARKAAETAAKGTGRGRRKAVAVPTTAGPA